MIFLTFFYFVFLLFTSIFTSESYPFGSSTSNTNRPKLKPFQFGNDLIEHKSVRVFCQLDSGTQPVSFKWLKDGVPIGSVSNHVKIEGSSDYSSLAIASLKGRRDNGNYSCLATNSFGTEIHSSILIVQEPPVFEEKPDDISIGLGQNHVLTCRATSPSHAIPRILWYRVHPKNQDHSVVESSHSDASIEDSKRKHISSGEKLHLVNVKLDDAGLYECIADAFNDLVISHLFTVTINVPPKFDHQKDKVEVKRGEIARLNCEVTGALPLRTSWFKFDPKTSAFQELTLDVDEFPYPRTKSIIEHKTIPEKKYIKNNLTLAELIIHDVSASDNGRYQCHAHNDFGKAVKTIDLLVQDVPGIIRDVQISQIWSRAISLHWITPDSTGNLALNGYIIQYWKELKSSAGNGGQQLHELEILPTEKQATIRNLAPGTAYVVRVIASNRFGHGEPSKLVRVITAEEAPNAAPIDIHSEAISTTTLRIRWKAPPKSHWNGQLRGYYLGYRAIDNVPDNDSDALDNVGFNYKEIPIQGEPNDAFQEEFLLNDLQKATKYSLILKAHNAMGEGPSSQEITVSTAANDPPPKAKLWIGEAKENSIVLKWSFPHPVSNVNQYIFYYREERKNSWLEISFQQNEKSKPETESNTFELTGLLRGTVYLIYMRSMAIKSALSEPSETIKIRTSGSEAIYSPLDSSSGLYPAVPTFVPTAISPYSSANSSQNIPPYLRLSFILPIAIATVIISIACVCAYVYVRIDDRKARLKAMTSSMGGNTIYGGTIAISPGKRFHYVSGPGPFTGQSNGGPFSPKHDSGFAGGAETQSLVSEESSMSFRYTDAANDNKKLLNSNGRVLQLPGLQQWAQTPILEEDEAIVEVADSCAYETLPFQRTNISQNDTQFQPLTSTPMKSFLAGSNVDTLPPPPPPLPVANKTSQITSAASTMSRASFPPPPPPLSNNSGSNSGTLKPSKSSNNAQFCHVDIHHVISDPNHSDSYDDFHLFGAQV